MTTTQMLKKTSLFKALSDDQLKALVRLSQEESFQPGEKIFKHGQQAKTFYVLLRGSVSLRIDAPEELAHVYHCSGEKHKKTANFEMWPAVTY